MSWKQSFDLASSHRRRQLSRSDVSPFPVITIETPFWDAAISCSLDFILTLVSAVFNYGGPFFLKFVYLLVYIISIGIHDFSGASWKQLTKKIRRRVVETHISMHSWLFYVLCARSDFALAYHAGTLNAHSVVGSMWPPAPLVRTASVDSDPSGAHGFYLR